MLDARLEDGSRVAAMFPPRAIEDAGVRHDAEKTGKHGVPNGSSESVNARSQAAYRSCSRWA
jgi:hypothetical protein